MVSLVIDVVSVFIGRNSDTIVKVLRGVELDVGGELVLNIQITGTLLHFVGNVLVIVIIMVLVEWWSWCRWGDRVNGSFRD